MKPNSAPEISSNPHPILPWTVYVDDNFDYMDEDATTVHGRYANLEEAIAACIAITDASVKEHGDGYTSFGDDPWVSPRPSAEELAAALSGHPEWPAAAFDSGFFSAWTYAGLLRKRPEPEPASA